MKNLTRWFSMLALLSAALPAAAQGEVVVYCTVQEEWCRPMVAAFEKTTGIKVLMTRKSSGEFYARSRPRPRIRRATSGGAAPATRTCRPPKRA